MTKAEEEFWCDLHPWLPDPTSPVPVMSSDATRSGDTKKNNTQPAVQKRARRAVNRYRINFEGKFINRLFHLGEIGRELPLAAEQIQ
jgi:hypothetical protein